MWKQRDIGLVGEDQQQSKLLFFFSNFYKEHFDMVGGTNVAGVIFTKIKQMDANQFNL